MKGNLVIKEPQEDKWKVTLEEEEKDKEYD